MSVNELGQKTKVPLAWMGVTAGFVFAALQFYNTANASSAASAADLQRQIAVHDAKIGALEKQFSAIDAKLDKLIGLAGSKRE